MSSNTHYNGVDLSRVNPSLHDFIKQWLNTPFSSGVPDAIPVEERRLNSNRGHLSNGAPLRRIRRVEDYEIPRKDGSLMNVRLYLPTVPESSNTTSTVSAASSSSSSPTSFTPLPLMVYFHGGGWVVGSLSSHDPLCRCLAIESNCAILSVDYRMAPEYPAPAALDDAVEAYTYITRLKTTNDNYGILNYINPSHLFIGGDSAGANIAAALAIELSQNYSHLVQPLLQVLIYPTLDMTLSSGPSYTTYAEGYYLRTVAMKWYVDMYLGKESLNCTYPSIDPKDVRVSPLFATKEILQSVCPAFIMTAGHDPLLSDGEAYTALLKQANVPVEYHTYEDMIHGCVCMYALAPKRVQEIYETIGRAVKRSVLTK